MNIEQYKKLQKLSSEQQTQMEDGFDIVLITPAHTEAVYHSLHTFFLENKFSLETIKMYYQTYWKWYVRCTWKRFLELKPEEVLMHVQSQLSTAYQLGIDVEDSVFYYLHRHFQEDDQQPFFNKIRDAVFASKMLVNPMVENSMTIGSLAQKIILNSKLGGDSLKNAEFLAELQRMLFPSDNVTDLNEEKKRENTLSLFDFIIFLDEEKYISEVIYNYLDNLFFGNEQGEELVNKSSAKFEIKEEINPSAPIPSQSPAETPASKSTKKTKPTPVEIKKLVETRFKPNAEGEIENVEGVMAMLDSLAEQYGDKGIGELYYFDENSEKFIWNV